MSDKVQKLEEKLQAALKENNYYEAHQICRTIHHRLLRMEKYDELLQFLYTNCVIFCEAKEFNSAVDMVQLFVEAMKKGNIKISDDLTKQLRNIFTRIPNDYMGGCDPTEQLDSLSNPTEKPAAPAPVTTEPASDRKEVEMDLD